MIRMDKWIGAALDYIPRWLEYQMRLSEQPGCVIAIAYKGKLVLEQAFGHADLAQGIALTPRHRFRVASHSKSFTAAGVLKLREQAKCHYQNKTELNNGLDVINNTNHGNYSSPATAPAGVDASHLSSLDHTRLGQLPPHLQASRDQSIRKLRARVLLQASVYD